LVDSACGVVFSLFLLLFDLRESLRGRGASQQAVEGGAEREEGEEDEKGRGGRRKGGRVRGGCGRDSLGPVEDREKVEPEEDGEDVEDDAAGGPGRGQLKILQRTVRIRTR